MNPKHNLRSVLFLILSLLGGVYSCDKVDVPTLETLAVTGLTDISAFSGGNILSNGGALVTEKGLCWKKGYNSSVTDNLVINSEDSLKYTSQMTELEAGSAYCVRAYAKNSAGVGYGNSVYFTTYPKVPFISDVSTNSITSNSATLSGHFVFGTGLIVYSTGLCYSRSPHPDLSNSFVASDVVSDTIKINLSALLSNTVYYVRLCVLLRLVNTTNYYAVFGNESNFTTKAIPVPPSIITGTVTSVTNSKADISGEVVKDGNAPILQRGICIGTKEFPTISDTIILSPGDTGKFYIKLQDLKPTTTYYARAFATNSAGTSYGLQVRFKTYTDTVKDIMGHVYTTMQFGTQVWIRENLQVTVLNDGTEIQNIIDNTAWYYLSTPGYCWYNNTKDTTYGALYNWIAVNTGKLCPSGWHVPSYNDWLTLINYFGGFTTINFIDKEVGFLALPGGRRENAYCLYQDRGNYGYWWSSTEDPPNPLSQSLRININGGLYLTLSTWRSGYSVRCVKD
jgi:uncharacterized protein (TIGR02145 family)